MNLNDCSNFDQVLTRAKHYYGDDVILLASTRATKKYMIFNPHTNLWILYYNDAGRGNTYISSTSSVINESTFSGFLKSIRRNSLAVVTLYSGNFQSAPIT
jgi:hypothetical protein